MNRTEFLQKLKEVTTILESNEILYDVIFDYRNKKEFKNIKLLINDYIDINMLTDLFGTLDKVKDNFIQINYSDIKLVFIKANNDNWLNAFYYYSGEIISDCINKMANEMGMSYTNTGLYYTNTATPILVTNIVFDIINFFELKSTSLLTGFDDINYIHAFIINSSYFNANIFSLADIKTTDFLYEEKIENYKTFLDIIEPFKSNTNSNYEYQSKEEYIDLIDLYFPESNLLKKYCLQNMEYAVKKIQQNP